MERYITLKDNDFHLNAILCYSSIKNAADTTTYIYLNSDVTSNKNRYFCYIDEINKSIGLLHDLYPENDKRREIFKYIDGIKLIEEITKELNKKDI